MIRRRMLFALLPAWLGAAGAAAALCQTATGTMAFTVSMDRPNTHYYHVVFRCDGLRGETQDFKMPVWMPGYYRIMDYSKDVVNFQAIDGAGRKLPWVKSTKNGCVATSVGAG